LFHRRGVGGDPDDDAVSSHSAPTDPVSLEPMTDSYKNTHTPNAPHRPRVGGGHDWQL